MSKSAATSTPNLKTEYYFYIDHLKICNISKNSNATYIKNYNDIQYKSQDKDYIYLTFDNTITAIDKRSCSDNLTHILSLLNIKETNVANSKIKSLLLALFVLSLFSIFIALMLVMIAINNSPLPEFPLAIAEKMWVFFLVTPIPISSYILGHIYIKKGYKCKKNIIAGIIVAIILCLYGSFTFAFAKNISHDFNYITELSKEIPINLPDSGYISIEYNNQSYESLALVKLDKDEAEEFSSNIKLNDYWHKDATFIPSNAIDLYSITVTSHYDCFLVYSLTEYEFDNFNGKLVYMAYDEESCTLYIIRNN